MSPAAKAVDAETRAFRKRAKEAVKSYQTALQSVLLQSIAKGGPHTAINVCSVEAPKIAAHASQEHLTVRRVGTRVRNKKTNQPTAGERRVFEQFSESNRPFVGRVDDKLTFMQPIYITLPICLGCHGHESNLSDEVKAQLAQHYPGDEATGYAVGDLRGAFVVQEEP